MARNSRFSVNTDTSTLLLLAGVGAVAYLWFNRGSIAQQAAAAAASAAEWGLQATAGGVYGAAQPIVNALFPYRLDPVGAMNPQGFPPPVNDPYYAEWLAQAAGQPGLVDYPGGGGPVGDVFRQFTPAPGSPNAWPTPDAQYEIY